MGQGIVRIIAGKWRGRKINVPSGKDLRPTPDRVRETLFNWLTPHIHGARCLDAFAGTGALGLEALSRGASEVVFIEQSRDALITIKKQLHVFEADNAECVQGAMPLALKKLSGKFDVVFLDPPYKSELLLPTVQALSAYLSHHALIYLEADKEITDNDLPENWELIKSKKAGQVFYHLAKYLLIG